MDDKLWWYIARAGGLTAWWLLCIAVLWGLLLSTRLFGDRPRPAWLLDLHRMLGALAVVFTGVHMAGLYLDTWSSFSWSELLVPLASKYRPGAVAWGVVAMWLLVTIELTSLVRNRIPELAWRWVHRTAFVVFVLAVVHTFTAGTDSASPWVRDGALLVGCGFVFMLVFRLANVRPPRVARPTPVPAPVTANARQEAATEPVLVGAGVATGGAVRGAGSGDAPATARGRFHRLQVSEIVRETPEAVSVAFTVPTDLVPTFRFDPGQHLTLRTWLDGDEVRRSYSLCSGVTDGELRIAVKQVEGGRASGWMNQHLNVGDTVEVSAPTGRFRAEVNPLHQRHLLGIAAGSGITPVLSILKSVLAVEPRSRFTLVYGNRDARSTIFGSKLARLQQRHPDRLQVVHVHSRCDLVQPPLQGRIDAGKIRELEAAGLVSLDDVDDAYLCGPQEMTVQVRDALAGRGMCPDRVHVELFGSRTTQPDVESTTPLPLSLADRHVAVVDRGARAELEVKAGETILDAALRQGLDLPYSCRDGVCGTCQGRLACGQVSQEGADLTQNEIDQGYVLPCQARPQSDGVVVVLDD